jgi:transcriptional regulator with XRE-family HTH domain
MGILDVEKMETLRIALDLSQDEAAKRAGLGSRQRWSDIVNGRRENLTLDTLEGIAKALGTTAKNLLK